MLRKFALAFVAVILWFALPQQASGAWYYSLIRGDGKVTVWAQQTPEPYWEGPYLRIAYGRGSPDSTPEGYKFIEGSYYGQKKTVDINNLVNGEKYYFSFAEIYPDFQYGNRQTLYAIPSALPLACREIEPFVPDTPIKLNGKIVTYVQPSGSGFYVADPGNIGGAYVTGNYGVSEGDVVDLVGKKSGWYDVTPSSVTVTGSVQPLKPFRVPVGYVADMWPNRSTLLINQNQKVKITGKVIEKQSSSFKVSDGSAKPVLVAGIPGVSVAVGDHVTVTGVSVIDYSYPVKSIIYPSSSADIVVEGRPVIQGTISIRVTDKTDVPIEGVLVRTAGKSAVTSTDGRAQIEDLPTGSFNIVLTHPETVSKYVWAQSQTVPVETVIKLDRRMIIRGRVTDFTGQPVPASLSLTAIVGENEYRDYSSRVDANGYYQFSLDTPYGCWLEVYSGWQDNAFVVISAKAGITVKDFVFDQKGVIKGEITRQPGVTYLGIKVFLANTTGSGSVSFNVEGDDYIMRGVPAGTYEVWAEWRESYFEPWKRTSKQLVPVSAQAIIENPIVLLPIN